MPFAVPNTSACVRVPRRSTCAKATIEKPSISDAFAMSVVTTSAMSSVYGLP